MKNFSAEIIFNRPLVDGYYRLRFKKAFASFQPGQFCMLQVPGLTETLLRRPFSLCREEADCAEIVYKVVGPTTRALSQLKEGRQLNLLGPLGQGLDWQGYRRVVGIAGGYGIAPMLGLAEHLRSAGIAYAVYYGARSKQDLLLCQDFAQAEIPLHITTEDGSAGLKGLVTEALHQDRSQLASTGTLWFVCGPHGLLQVAAKLAKSWGVACRVSMEEVMGCGVGVCLGCVVPCEDGAYRRSCVEGPVLESQLISW